MRMSSTKYPWRSYSFDLLDFNAGQKKLTHKIFNIVSVFGSTRMVFIQLDSESAVNRKLRSIALYASIQDNSPHFFLRTANLNKAFTQPDAMNNLNGT